jgi:EPS-associated MarR family transcriptional regulator
VSLKLDQTSLNNHLNTRTATQEETHYKVMCLLEENPDLTQRELAQSLGVSVGSVNYCLRALVDKGWVKMKNFATSKNKFGYIYVLTPTGMAEKAAITHRFLLRKMYEYEQLKAEIEALKSEVKNDHEEMQKV